MDQRPASTARRGPWELPVLVVIVLTIAMITVAAMAAVATALQPEPEPEPEPAAVAEPAARLVRAHSDRAARTTPASPTRDPGLRAALAGDRGRRAIDAVEADAAEAADETDVAPAVPEGWRVAEGRFAGEHRVPLTPADTDRLAPFAGLSTWIDLYDVAISPEEQVRRAAAGGAESIFVQSARHNSPSDIHDADRLGRLLDAAADEGLWVMTWYFATFEDVELDTRRSIAAAHFTSPGGNSPDAFGLDIEAEHVTDIETRNRRLLEVSRNVREAAGDVPLAAIVMPPLQLDLRMDWWPEFPYAEMAELYDVTIPMSYSSFRGTDPQVTYQWNLDNITETRRRAGVDDLPIHFAGGIADNLPEVEALVEAMAEGDVLGGGLYDLHTTPASSWGPLRALRATD